MLLKNTSLNPFVSLRKKAEAAAGGLDALLIAAEGEATHVLHGEHAQKKAGPGEKFWQYREYRTEDRPQDIDWRQSAKTDRVYIRQKEWQTPQTALFWCQSGPGMQFQSDTHIPSKGEAGRILALAMAMLMAKVGEQVGYLGQTQTGKSDHAIQSIARGLLQEQQRPLEQLLDTAPQNASLVLCDDFLDPIEDIKERFKKIAQISHKVVIIQVLDPAELDLPYEGRGIFQDPGSGLRETIEHIPSIRTAYQARLRDHIQAVKEHCGRAGWYHILHRTDLDVSKTLFCLWGEISGKARHAGGGA